MLIFDSFNNNRTVDGPWQDSVGQWGRATRQWQDSDRIVDGPWREGGRIMIGQWKDRGRTVQENGDSFRTVACQ